MRRGKMSPLLSLDRSQISHRMPNCIEAYKVDVYVGYGLTDGGGSAPIDIEVFDHQGTDTIDP